MFEAKSLLGNDNSLKKKGMNVPPGNMGWPLLGETLAFQRLHPSISLDEYMEDHITNRWIASQQKSSQVEDDMPGNFPSYRDAAKMIFGCWRGSIRCKSWKEGSDRYFGSRNETSWYVNSSWVRCLCGRNVAVSKNCSGFLQEKSLTPLDFTCQWLHVPSPKTSLDCSFIAGLSTSVI